MSQFFPSVLIRICTTVIDQHDQKQFSKEMIYVFLYHSGHILSLKEVMTGTHGRNLKVGTETEAMKYAVF